MGGRREMIRRKITRELYKTESGEKEKEKIERTKGGILLTIKVSTGIEVKWEEGESEEV